MAHVCRKGGVKIMAWSVLENISASSKWLKRKTELIEQKEQLIQRKNAMGSSQIVQAYRGAIFDAELGEGNIGGEKNKTRPVLVISPNRLNKGHTVVVVPLSTKFKLNQNGLPKYRNHYLLKQSNYSFLVQDSVIKFEDIRSIDVVRLRQLRGNISIDDMHRMEKNLKFTCGY